MRAFNLFLLAVGGCGKSVDQTLERIDIFRANVTPYNASFSAADAEQAASVANKVVGNHKQPRSGDTEWRVATKPEGDCGWGTAACFITTTDAKTDDNACGDPKAKATYRKENLFFKGGCKGGPFDSVCLATVNDGKGKKKGQDKDIAGKCQGADVIVFAVQEMKPGFGEFLGRYGKQYGYSHVGRCDMGGGYKKGPAVSVVAKRKERFLFLEEDCEEIRENDKSFSNLKGTIIMPFYVVSEQGRDTFVAASTHGTRKASDPDKERVEGFKDAAEAILGDSPKFAILGGSPKFVAWGGDFNMRTEMGHKMRSELPSLAGKYTTSPTDSSLTPKEVRLKLKETEDVLGKGVKWQEVLQKAGQDKLVDVDVRGHLCPSYYKAAQTVTTGGGMFSFSEKKTEERKRLACQAADGDPVEYYLHQDDMETDWGKGGRAPSWTERLIVSKSLDCGDAEKIIAEEDHDTVYTKCKVV